MKLQEVTTPSRAEQLAAFGRYAERLTELSPKFGPIFKEVGVGLFKAGFTYEDTEFSMLPDAGGVYEFNFPNVGRRDGTAERGDVHVNFYVWRKGDKYSYQKTMGINEIKLWTVPLFLKYIRETAKKDV